MTAPSRTWAEVELDAIAHNYKEFCRVTGGRVMCVLKANGYGHGAVMPARRLLREGCDAFGAAALDEGIELRRAGVSAFILIMSHIPESRVDEALEHGLRLTVFSKEMARRISDRAVFLFRKGTQRNAKVHIKVDTGMTRVGFNPDEVLSAVKYIGGLPGIEIEGIFTHFSSSDEQDRRYTDMQIERFNSVLKELEENGFGIKIKHAANSSAALLYPEARYDMVRVGISLYGCYTSADVPENIVNLRPAMQFKSRIIRINEVPPGVSVSYGRKFVTERKSRLATIPAGYGDGYSRILTGKACVLVNGQAAPVAGAICMDQCVIDITDVSGEVAVGDEVVLFGTQKGGRISAEQAAEWMDTINYEVLCMVSGRVPRFYIENGNFIT